MPRTRARAARPCFSPPREHLWARGGPSSRLHGVAEPSRVDVEIVYRSPGRRGLRASPIDTGEAAKYVADRCRAFDGLRLRRLSPIGEHPAVGFEAGIRGEPIDPLRSLPAGARGALGFEQLREIGSLNTYARHLPVEDRELQAGPVSRDTKVLGDEVAVDQRPGQRVAECRELAPMRLERVELGQKTLEYQCLVGTSFLAPQLPRDLLTRLEEVHEVVPRSPVGQIRGFHLRGVKPKHREPARSQAPVLRVDGRVAVGS